MSIKYHSDGTLPPLSKSVVFVFGSNLAGIHGAGAAKAALEHFGAKFGVGIGRHGYSYAIPTKAKDVYTTLLLPDIEKHVATFVAYATYNPDIEFFITRIGCGLAGWRDENIAPMFSPALPNCSYPANWRTWLQP